MSKLPMNLPNRITIARIALIPLYLVLVGLFPLGFNWPAALVFLIAACTDWLDGNLARKRNEITDFGKFMDPIADKLLVLLPIIQLMDKGAPVDLWVVLVMVAREIIVSGFRMVAAGKGNIIAADWSGKIKTTIQIIAVLLLTLNLELGRYIAWIAAALSLYSGVEILVRNRAVLEEPE